MPASTDIHIRVEGAAGRITLNRPQALNALTYDMCMAIGRVLPQWQNDKSVELVIIDAEGSKAFCAGGDIADLYATGTDGDFDFGRKFWADEYRVNAAIKNFPKPFVAIMDGIVMGGGVGISAHGSHRVVTENTLFAMPECAIGLLPDVGGNWLLSRAPGHIGEYLGATGARLKAGDCLYAGLADHFVPQARLDDLVTALTSTGDVAQIERFTETIEAETLVELRSEIDRHFKYKSALEVAHSLENSPSPWEQETLKLLRRGCPLSVACAVEVVNRSRALQRIEDILALEYRFTYRSMSHGDFLEGIRAQIIDKDRNPKWKTPTLEELDQSEISGMLETLGSDELAL